MELIRTFKKKFQIKNVGGFFTLAIFLLSVFGLIVLYSSTQKIHKNGQNLIFMQMLWFCIGWSIYLAVLFFKTGILYRLAYPIYTLNLFLLFLVKIMGESYYGAQRWLNLGFAHFQPSEMMKFSIVLVMARYLSQKENFELHLKDLLWPAVLVLPAFLLVVSQPDLATAMIFVLLCAFLLFIAKINTKLILSLVLVSMVVAGLGWKFGLKEYQKRRVYAFLSPDSDPLGSTYNIIQSKIAIGSGQATGKGLFKGTQSRLQFLPETHTDFIFSVLSEELGFLGVFFVLILFLFLFLCGISMTLQARELFDVYLSLGCLFALLLHVIINISMVMGLLPVVGLPLPFFSYGGSYLVVTMLFCATIHGVYQERLLNN